MTNLFRAILGMSVAGGLVALAVMLIRVPLKKAPRIFSYILWGVVLFRLICPVTYGSTISFMPTDIAGDIGQAIQQQFTSLWGVEEMQSPAFPILSEADEIGAVESKATSNAALSVLDILAWIWMCGVVFMLGHCLFSYIRLRHRLATAVLVEENVYETDRISTPFVFGLFEPRIYLPLHTYSDCILEHEHTHIRRGDHWIKFLAFITLALHWFNPIAWVSFRLMSEDMETSCDESVLRRSMTDIRTDYSQSLLSLSEEGIGILASPAFGKSNVSSRIKNALRYRKPPLWLGVVALAVVLVAAAGFMTHKSEAKENLRLAAQTGHSFPFMYANSYFLDGNNGWLTRNAEEDLSKGGNEVYRTVDGGKNWDFIYRFPTTTQDGITSTFYASSVFFLDTQHGIIVGYRETFPHFIYVTDDGGLSWQNYLAKEEHRQDVLPYDKYGGDERAVVDSLLSIHMEPIDRSKAAIIVYYDLHGYALVTTIRFDADGIHPLEIYEWPAERYAREVAAAGAAE